MAQVLGPAITSQRSPLLTPPATDFPYPGEQETMASGDKSNSDSTLVNPPVTSDDERPNLGACDRGKAKDGPRPSMAKFMTEAPRPVAPGVPLVQRRSTGARPALAPPTGQLSDSSDDWSSDEEEEGLQTSGARPGQDAQSKRRFHQVRRRPEQPQRQHTTFNVGNDNVRTRGKIAKDGRLNISVNETANKGYLAKALGSTLRNHLETPTDQDDSVDDEKRAGEPKFAAPIPRLNIVIMVIGSRGDIQPFLKIGKILRDKFGHRVRIATHPTFKKFVEEDIGLDFFSVGGDPSELMAFMVKNPGLIPSLETVKAGEIGRRRESMYEMFQGFWRACINATDDEKDVANYKMMGQKYPFVADAIIANPPSFAHFHIAERLGIPLHLVFTFPYTPTQDFPHPLANIKASNVDREYTNFMSYPLVDLMTWQGLGDLVNRFRVTTLGLEPVSTLWAPGQLSRLKVPMTYLWSPGLVPKPKDWGPEIDIAGYVFLDLASNFQPEEPLAKFLETPDDRPLIYIGFGSISGIDDPRAFTQLIFDAVREANVRALISKGWGNMGEGVDAPEGVYMLGNIPHDWLFPKVDAVVHHGGAGTTAIGLKCGKPTMIIPFFGDQPFWSAMIAKAGAGAKESIPLKRLTVEKFAEGIRQCLSSEAREKAQEIARSIEAEGDGAMNAVNAFHRALPLDGMHGMRCAIFEDRLAVWQVKHTHVNLSALAADLLVESKQLRWSDLHLLKHYEWTDFSGPGEPITGVGGAAVAALQEVIHGFTSIGENTKRDLAKQKRRRRKLLNRKPEDSQEKTKHVKIQGNAEPTAARPRQDDMGKESDGLAHQRPPMPSRATTAGIEPLSTGQVVARDVSKGLGHSAKAILIMPLDIFMALTLGFRNAPRLYGDRTVRPPPHAITGFRSGVRLAGTELGLGFYDGVTGLVRIPYADVKEDGFVGLPKGVARGVGGLVLKPISGVLGLGAYTGKGVQVGIRKRVKDTYKTERWIRRARMVQGANDINELTLHSGPSKQPTVLSQKNKKLEEMRRKALSQWTTHERDMVMEVREKEKRMSLLPAKNRKSVDRPPSITVRKSDDEPRPVIRVTTL